MSKAMTGLSLSQRRLGEKRLFSLADDHVVATVKRVTSSRTYRVPFEDIGAHPVEVRSSSGGRFAWATVLTILSAASLYTLLFTPTMTPEVVTASVFFTVPAALTVAAYWMSRKHSIVYISAEGREWLEFMKGRPDPASLAAFLEAMEERKRTLLVRRYVRPEDEGEDVAAARLEWLHGRGVITGELYDEIRARLNKQNDRGFAGFVAGDVGRHVAESPRAEGGSATPSRLVQRWLFDRKRFDLSNDHLLVSEKTLFSSRRFRVPMDELQAIPVEMHTSSKPAFYWAAGFLALFAAMALMVVQPEGLGPDALTGPGVLWVLASLYYLMSRRRYVVFGGGPDVVAFLKDRPDATVLAQFLARMKERKRELLMRRYLAPEREDPRSVLNRLEWLRRRGIISAATFDRLREDVLDGDGWTSH